MISLEKKHLFVSISNVPLDENFVITDDTRMRAAVQTINKVISRRWFTHYHVALWPPKRWTESKIFDVPPGWSFERIAWP